MADLYQVDRRALDLIWDQLAATWSRRSSRRRGPSAEIRKWITLGQIQLWLALEDPGWLVRDWRTRPLGIILTWRSGRRLAVHVVTARELTTWLPMAVRRLHALMEKHGFDGMHVYVRPGWRKVAGESFEHPERPLSVAVYREVEMPPYIPLERSA